MSYFGLPGMKWPTSVVLICAALCFGGAARADITSGLISYLRLDETNGLTAFDATAYGRHANLTNFPAGNGQWVAGRTNGGLNFNASTNNQRAVIDDSLGGLNFGGKTNAVFSIAVWVKGVPGVQSPGAGIVAKGYGRGNEQYTIDTYNNAFRFFVRNSAGTAQMVASGVAVDGTWQHLVGTYDGGNASSGLKFYINGQLAGSNSAASMVLSNRHEISLGSREDNSTSGYNLPFYGTLDEVRIYARALGLADVEDLYNAAGGAPPPVPDAEFTALRLLWRDMLNGGTNLNTADPDVVARLATLTSLAQSLWDAMDKGLARTFLWSDVSNLAGDSGHLWFTYDRLKTLALAYSTAGGALHHNPALRTDLLSALDWMYDNFYNENKTQVGNWWHWQIGVPLRLNDITVLLYDTLTGTQVKNYMRAINKFTPAPSGTAANLVWMATVVGVRGVIAKESGKIFSAAGSLSSVFPYVTSGDGFYRDGSFIQHSYYPYTGSYGSSLMVFLAPLLRMLDGSRWAVTDTRMTNVFEWAHGAYQPVIYKGAIMDMVRGRAIARESETDRIIGHQTIAGILWLAQFAPPGDALVFKAMVKEWIQTDTARKFCATIDLGAIPPAKAILGDSLIPARGELVGHYHFGSMDRVVHLRPGFGLGLSLSSSRIANFESFSSENLRGWYAAAGMTYLYNTDLMQFSDGFWPTVNSYRLPGTTVDTQARAEGSGAGYRSPHNWVGGAALGEWGAAGMQLDAWSSTLAAKKSWFMFDDEIVCLGAGISSGDNRGVETIVENRMLQGAGTNTLTVNGTVKPSTLSWSEAMPDTAWAHLAGNVAGADLGYYFSPACTVRGLREARSGSWDDIDHYYGNSTNSFTRNYYTLWLEHGTNPVNESYSYVLLPNKSAAEVAAYAAGPNVEVLENTPSVQSVREGPLGVTAVNFWNDGVQSAGNISVDRKCSVVVQVTETNLSVGVADPTQTNSAGISLGINQAVLASLSVDAGITVGQLAPTLQLTVNTGGSAGKTFRANFSYYVTNFAGFQSAHFSPGQAAQAGIGDPAGDPDQDGLNNALEYALVLDPWQPDAWSLQPRVESGRFSVDYVRRKLAGDLAYVMEVSTNLVSWDSSGAQVEETILSETATTQTIRATDKSLLGAHSTRYIRLRITMQP